jgi:hypothetical protein
MAANQPQAAWTERCPTLEERVHVDGAGTPPASVNTVLYCSLTSEQRIEGLRKTEASAPCPPDCCPE